MRRPVILKFFVTLIVTLLVCLAYKYFWKEKISLTTVLISLACVLPITLMIKLPEKK
jgi:hypothetical protein